MMQLRNFAPERLADCLIFILSMRAEGYSGTNNRGRPMHHKILLAIAALTAFSAPTLAQDAPPPVPGSEAEKLANQLANPISSLISVPLQLNWNTGGGYASNGNAWTLNVQPVIPFSISENFNLISRTIVPFVTQSNITAPPPSVPADYQTGQTGIGDTTQSFFFSPKKPLGGKIIFGAGPAMLIPTSTSTPLGNNQFSIGPTFVALTQTNGWTVGILMNQLWSVGGSTSTQNEVNQMFIQPFIAHADKKGRTYGINTETTCNWNAVGTQCAVPINVTAAQLVRFGHQPVQFTIGARYYVVQPEGAPQWGMRFVTTFLFPAG